MRILFVIKSLSLPGGGAEKVLSEIAFGLSTMGHGIDVASFDLHGSSDFYSFARGISRERLGVGNVSRATAAADFIGIVRSLRKLLLRSAPDVAVGFMHSSFVPLAIAALGTGVPIIASEHTAVEHYRRRPLQFRLVRWSATVVKAMTIPSERIRQAFPPGLAAGMVVIPNPVTIEPTSHLDFGGDGSRILAVGGLRQEKGHSVLISAFARIAGTFPGWTLRLVGEGPCRPALEQQIAELGLSERVILAGAIADVAGEYASADLLAVPSSYESFGLATAEGLAYGVPAVGFADCPGTNELIVDGVNGLLVRGDDRIVALAEGLARLMADSDLRHRLGAAGPASVKQYALGSVCKQWEKLMGSVVRGHGVHGDSAPHR